MAVNVVAVQELCEAVYPMPLLRAMADQNGQH